MQVTSSHYFLTTAVGKQPRQKGTHKEVFYEKKAMRVSSVILEILEALSGEKD